MNIVFRDLDQFPDLVAKVRDGLANATMMLALLLNAIASEPIDADALAAVAVGPTIDFKIKQHMLGFTPLGITEERFVAAWVKSFSHLFDGVGQVAHQPASAPSPARQPKKKGPA